ncbi:DeoR/GlpR family DNA-binding transcription regulator [Proteinivorax tanatarense]|uniref:DeoR/GlpR family DNA-binding transcription regulator n=1 Tax=Proteinivorax tanatarense TaxID=1260629 RepID=A0AAU7VMP2_9FIRM
MLPAERRKEIIEVLKREEKIVVDEVAEKLNVSPMTIRRDLQQLEKEEVLTRTHGGAVLGEKLTQEIPYNEKKQENTEAKGKIADQAAALIEDGYTIILDAGTTNMAIAKRLDKFKNIKVVTNDLLIASYLSQQEVDVYCSGGEIQKNTGACFGSSALKFFSEVYADITFVGTSAVDVVAGITTPTLDKAELKKKMLSAGEKKVLVADSSKFGKKSFAKVVDLRDLDVVITDSDLPKNLIDTLSSEQESIKATIV